MGHFFESQIYSYKISHIGPTVPARPRVSRRVARAQCSRAAPAAAPALPASALKTSRRRVSTGLARHELARILAAARDWSHTAPRTGFETSRATGDQSGY